MSGYRIAEAAQKDLIEVLATIAQDNESVASLMSARFVETVELLAFSPGMGRVFRPERTLRRTNIDDDAVLYRKVADEVEIARVSSTGCATSTSSSGPSAARSGFPVPS